MNYEPFFIASHNLKFIVENNKIKIKKQMLSIYNASLKIASITEHNIFKQKFSYFEWELLLISVAAFKCTSTQRNDANEFTRNGISHLRRSTFDTG